MQAGQVHSAAFPRIKSPAMPHTYQLEFSDYIDKYPRRTYLEAEPRHADRLEELGARWDKRCPCEGGRGAWCALLERRAIIVERQIQRVACVLGRVLYLA